MSKVPVAIERMSPEKRREAFRRACEAHLASLSPEERDEVRRVRRDVKERRAIEAEFEAA